VGARSPERRGAAVADDAFGGRAPSAGLAALTMVSDGGGGAGARRLSPPTHPSTPDSLERIE